VGSFAGKINGDRRRRGIVKEASAFIMLRVINKNADRFSFH